MSIEYMTLGELWARIVEDRAALEALWLPLDDDALLAVPGPQADWSVKDLIAHIMWWESYALNKLPAALLQDGGPVSHEETNRINAEVRERYAETPLDDVLEMFDTSLILLEEAIIPLTDDELNNGYVIYLLIGNTFGHYADHYDDLLNYVNSI